MEFSLERRLRRISKSKLDSAKLMSHWGQKLGSVRGILSPNYVLNLPHFDRNSCMCTNELVKDSSRIVQDIVFELVVKSSANSVKIFLVYLKSARTLLRCYQWSKTHPIKKSVSVRRTYISPGLASFSSIFSLLRDFVNEAALCLCRSLLRQS